MQGGARYAKPARGFALIGSGLWAWLSLSGGNADTLTLHGNVDIRQVDLGFRVGGRIEKVLVEEGETVEAGQAPGQSHE